MGWWEKPEKATPQQSKRSLRGGSNESATTI